MFNKLLKALPFIYYLIKTIIRYEDRRIKEEKKNDVQNP